MKGKLYYLLVLFTVAATQSACSSDKQLDNPEEKQWKVLFEDHFNKFDEKVWTKEVHEPGWVNQELQAYDKKHVSVGRDGDKSVLILTAERKGNLIYSGRVNSKGKKSFQYGKLEASIKLPKTANGLWPAFWMMGDSEKPWPRCGEIDIMEMGNMEGIASGSTEKHVNTAIHYGENDGAGHHQEYKAIVCKNNLQDGEYHIYSLEWNEISLQIRVDDVDLYTFDISKNSGRYDYFHDKFYILFNLAVGGAFTGITDPQAITALQDGEKVNMYVDWVRILY